MIKIKTTTEKIESKGGLLLVGAIIKSIGIGSIKSSIEKRAGIIITSLLGLIVEGCGINFERMGDKRDSLWYKEALNLSVIYSKETVRIYLNKMALDLQNIIIQLGESAMKIIKKATLTGYLIGKMLYIPVDIDTSVMNNSKTQKEGVSRTYKRVDGYHPIFAYVGKEGYMLDCELRPGSQHCQKDTVAFITTCIEKLSKLKLGVRFLFRLDSGNDAFETLKVIIANCCYCIIKRNKRKESDEKWLKIAKRHGKLTRPRKGKKVWIGKINTNPKNKKGEILKDVYIVFEVTERKRDSAGQKLLIPEVEVNSWWTNLNCDAEKVIELYHEHATSEQFHSELKHDLGVERLPSGKLAVNKIPHE